MTSVMEQDFRDAFDKVYKHKVPFITTGVLMYIYVYGVIRVILLTLLRSIDYNLDSDNSWYI